MIPNRDNLRDALIAAAAGSVLAWTLGGCANQQQPPPTPTATQLAPEPASTPTPHITGAMILTEQSPEVQAAIKHGRPWPTFRWPREKLVPYTEHMTPLVVTVAPYEVVDLALLPGEQFAASAALGDSERFSARPVNAATAHAILGCKVTGQTTSAVFYSETHIYRVRLRCQRTTSVDSISYYDPEAVLAQMRAADAAPAQTIQELDPIAPTGDPSKLNTAYRIDGPANIPWRPVKVTDNGTRVWIQLPKTTSPITPAVFGDDGNALNYRIRNEFIVVDALFNHATLVSGTDRVTISRGGQ